MIRPLPSALQHKANTELNEDPTQIKENLNLFKDWLKKQEHIIYKDDDQLLLNFLRGSKFSLERAKEKIDAYYTFRSIAPEIARNLDSHLPAVEKYINLGICIPLGTPKEDITSPRVLLLNQRNDYDPDEITIPDMLKSLYIFCNILLHDDDNYAVSGLKLIWDMKNIKFKTVLQTTPDCVRKTVICFQQAFPTRLKAFYFINIPKGFEQVMFLAKQLSSKKIAKRLHVYSSNNWEVIFQDVPKSIFPYEYGGEGGHLNDLRDKWKKIIEAHRERLLEEDQYYCDESKRVDKSKTFSDIYGIDGSFRKLQID